MAGENIPSGDAQGEDAVNEYLHNETEWRSDMVDVTDLSLADLAALTEGQDSALALALRRLADDLTDPGEPIAGFNSAL